MGNPNWFWSTNKKDKPIHTRIGCVMERSISLLFISMDCQKNIKKKDKKELKLKKLEFSISTPYINKHVSTNFSIRQA